jgi:amino acid adenylation domain-containing protein
MYKGIDKNLLLFSSQFMKKKEYWLKKLSREIVDNKILAKDFPTQRFPASRVEIKIDIHESLCASLMMLSKTSDISIYIIVLSALKLLIYQYTGSEDVTVLSPLYKPKISTKTMNNRLLIFDRIHGAMTFKDVLLMVRQSTLEAYENQDYPFDRIIEYLFDSPPIDGGPVFSNIVCSLENIHNTINNEHVENLLAFSFKREGNRIEACISFHPLLYDKYQVENMSRHFVKTLEKAIQAIDIKINDIQYLSQEEKKRLLVDFNSRPSEYPRDKTIHELFEKSVKVSPDSTALVYEDECLTYNTLNQRANQLAARLNVKGVKRGNIVSIMVDRSIWMVVGLLAVLKTGGAYMPLDPEYPEERSKCQIKDSGSGVLLIQTHLMAVHPEMTRSVLPGHRVRIDDESIYTCQTTNPTVIGKSHDLAYVMYTSGTTGTPKGVMIEHGNVVNLLHWFGKTYNLQRGVKYLLLTNYTFDPSVEGIFGTLLHGAALHMGNKEITADSNMFRAYVNKNQIHMLDFVPTALKELLGPGDRLESLRIVICGGEPMDESLKDRLVEKGYCLYNHYGPTEITTDALTTACSKGNRVTLGKPIDNVMCYILNRAFKLVPVGIAGDLYVSGAGVGRGYLNNVEVTMENFTANPFMKGERLYRTGDIARWQPDGSIEFLGRKDHQVKIGGFRIELDEIKNLLLRFDKIKEAVVYLKTNENKEKYLCAYIATEDEFSHSQLNEFLSKRLPYYMIPAYIVPLDKIPLTANGKVDREKLPDPVGGIKEEYTAPRNDIEKKLVNIWGELLNVDDTTIGIDANFFEMGGQSLKATMLAARIHRDFRVRIPLPEIFKLSTLRNLSRFISKQEESSFVSLEPTEEKEYYVLSAAQKGMYALHLIDKSGLGYHVPSLIELEKPVDRKILQETFEKLVKRHETLRTAFPVIKGQPVQRIYRNVDFKLGYYECTKEKATGIIENFVKPFDFNTPPLLKAELVNIENSKMLLMVDMPHIITDGLSNDLLERDFNALYNRETLPGLKIQYKDYSEWQNKIRQEKKSEIKKQENFWLNEFKGDLPALGFPTDFPRPTIKNYAGNQIEFLIDEELTGRLKEIAQETETTLNMILLAVYYILLSKYTNLEDIVVGSPILGRRHADLHEIIGMFVNMLPLRNQPHREKSYRVFLAGVKNKLIMAMENQDYQFEELVFKLGLHGNPGMNPLFNVVFSMGNMESKEMKIGGSVNENTQNANENGLMYTSAVFDLILTAMAGQKDISMTLLYSSQLFKKEKAKKITQRFMDILKLVVENIDIKLKDISVSHKLTAADSSAYENEQGEFEF